MACEHMHKSVYGSFASFCMPSTAVVCTEVNSCKHGGRGGDTFSITEQVACTHGGKILSDCTSTTHLKVLASIMNIASEECVHDTLGVELSIDSM
jgi:hypothetical protein